MRLSALLPPCSVCKSFWCVFLAVKIFSQLHVSAHAAAAAGRNGTSDLVCSILERLRSDATENAEEVAKRGESDNEDYLKEVERQGDAFEDARSTLSMGVFTPAYYEERAELKARSGIPRLYWLKTWDNACEDMLRTLGYTYSLEHWIRGMINLSPMQVKDVAVADFVLLPLCPTSIFMFWMGKYTTTGRTGRYLLHEGRLQERPVRRTDQRYLLQRFAELAVLPEVVHCKKRASCRFLLPSIYGRHVWRNFSAALGEKVIFVTHAGLSDWPRRTQVHWTEGQNSKRRSDVAAHRRPPAWNTETNSEPGPLGCRAACAEHCVDSPAGALPVDIVLPWTVAWSWTPRSAFPSRRRDILAFFAGSLNSCSRARLAERFSASFEAATAGLACDGARARGKLPGGRKRAILIFQPGVRVHQADWSDLAYRSVFCLVPEGDSPNTARLVESIMHGCVPVIIMHRLQPPFADYLDWEKFSFFIREDAINDLEEILRGLSPDLVAEKQDRLAQVAHHLDYGGDGLNYLLYLSLRRRALEQRRLNKGRESEEIYW